MKRLHALLSILLVALVSGAWVIKDTANPVDIYTGANTTPGVRVDTANKVGINNTGTQQEELNVGGNVHVFGTTPYYSLGTSASSLDWHIKDTGSAGSFGFAVVPVSGGVEQPAVITSTATGSVALGPITGSSLAHGFQSGNVTSLRLLSSNNTSGLTQLSFYRGSATGLGSGSNIWNVQHDIATDNFILNLNGGAGNVLTVNTAGKHTIGSSVYSNAPHIVNGVMAQATTGTVAGGQVNVGTAVFTINSGSGASAVTGLMTAANIAAGGNNPINMQCTVVSSPWGSGSTGSWQCLWSGTGSNPWTCTQSCTLIAGSGTAPTPTSVCNTGSGASFGLTSGQTFSLITMNCTAGVGGSTLTWKTSANN